MFDKDITIINKYFDKTTKKNIYKTHIVKGFWSSNNGIAIGDTELVKNGGFKAYILMSETGYVKPSEYTGEKDTWTLQNDDYLVKGSLSEEVETITTIKDNYECMKITNISIKDYGSDEMQHYEVSGE